jgi:protein-S-isoprenylcysteine O-methyltransferase Ste14
VWSALAAVGVNAASNTKVHGGARDFSSVRPISSVHTIENGARRRRERRRARRDARRRAPAGACAKHQLLSALSPSRRAPRFSFGTTPREFANRRGRETRLLTIDPPALGRRGEGWVVLQSIVIAAAAACAVVGPGWPQAGEPWLRIAGFVLEAAGVGMFIVSRIALGSSFTPLPRPRDRSTLRRTGIYACARHPVYGGLLVGGLGLSLHRSPLVLAPTAVLALVFWLKSIREEAWLAERYPDYPAYRRATPRRFIPWII